MVAEKFTQLAERIHAETGDRRTPEAVAAGFLEIAVENMANAIKKISVQRGYDVSRYVLACFGGAGGQHACPVADKLGITRVLLHPYAGVLSAYGMGLADMVVMRERTVETALADENMAEIEAALDRLADDGVAEMRAQGVDADRIGVDRKLHVRYLGSDTSMVVDFADRAAIQAAFEAAHTNQYGFHSPEKQIIVETALTEVIGRSDTLEDPTVAIAVGAAETPVTPRDHTAVYLTGARSDAPIYYRESMQPGQSVTGPAVIIEPTATTVIEPGWRAELTDRLHLLLTRVEAAPRRRAVGTDVDPVMLEIFNNLFMNIAEQMGLVLERTAYSVNIKERLDFSCAVFDRTGELIANAPHMPVHLGSMDESIRTVIRENHGRMAPGDVYVLNAPYNGGTHLPDITVITPVFGLPGEPADEIQFYVASRGHHADVGGTTPGSMPPDSASVEEEGVLLDNVKLVDRGRFREAEIRTILTSGRWPSRNADQNILDLKAQIAACEKGVQELRRVVDQYGLEVVQAYMRHVQDNAEESVRRVIEVLQDGHFVSEMDDGCQIEVRVTIDRAARRARIDFTGTSPQHPLNYNAPTAVSRAAVLYVFRSLVDADIPLNSGCLKPIELIIPAGSMLRPTYPAAVVAGNVETSQCIANTLFGALGVQAAAQGTMNNFTFGNDRYQYYETICGGAGAGPDWHGTSAIHTHMTNSRLTDPEILEWRFPVLLESFTIRRGSGGKGRYHGGDGATRRIRFLEPLTASVLSSHRRVAPFGLAGGAPGEIGRNWVERANGAIDPLSGRDQTEMGVGDVFVISTPSGGGFGPADDDRPAAK